MRYFAKPVNFFACVKLIETAPKCLKLLTAWIRWFKKILTQLGYTVMNLILFFNDLKIYILYFPSNLQFCTTICLSIKKIKKGN